MFDESQELASKLVAQSERVLVFTGAGISVESGIPPFRGPNGLWSKYDPATLEVDYFLRAPELSWPVIKEVFYSYFDSARPNAAHIVLAELERTGIVSAVVTQNIDGLHQAAGSQRVIEFHGSSTSLSCLECGKRFSKDDVDFSASIPSCSDCHGVLKPDFVFFGEGIPPRAYGESIVEAETCDVVLIVGTTGEVMPACSIPRLAKNRGASVIEVNTEKTRFTEEITDVFLEGQASVTLEGLAHRVSALKGI